MNRTGIKKVAPPVYEEQVKAYFRSGITGPWGDAEMAAAEKLTNLLIELGDAELVGDGTRFDPDLFRTQAG